MPVNKKWEVEYSDEFEEWWETLPEDVQEAIAHDIDVLEQVGPTLGRPQVDTLKDSKHRNLKELRTEHGGRQYRTLFAFDPRRTAILLIGGDKTGDRRFYKDCIRKADDIYDKHLNDLRSKGTIK